ncbi:hypothetical protein AMAG_17158 [Allomyces macrogynus ATCC 38327]|uniref:Uncharacterized protein n=1 Tax=Allomyces macrogynus (strain ATCC 38327) TaxID=578462 RepID=A0A0L0TDE4_ALLM3|nr:hypothetical protein AMAG_17158 [Allomyces macrogynus ATCC 38327]|eukprot:KNE72923.1 hypothetical protein AMAG_17158 [Allomyces macrogynus ATCC 38327]
MSASSDSLTPAVPTMTPAAGGPDGAGAVTPTAAPIPMAAPAPTTTTSTARSTSWLVAMPSPSTTPLVTTFSGINGALRTEITAGNPYGKIVYPNSSEWMMAVTVIFPTSTSNPIPTATSIPVRIRGNSGQQGAWAQRSAIFLAILVAAGLAISVIRRRLRRLKEHPLARRERHLLKADRRMLQTTTSVVVDTLPRYDTTEQEHATGGGLRARASALVIRPVSWTWTRMSTLWSPQPPASPPPPMPPSPTGPGGEGAAAEVADGSSVGTAAIGGAAGAW